jgi:hypothetical protein
MRYALEQRLRLIDFLLAQYGWLHRKMVMDYYAITMAAASKDFADYMKLAPDNMAYNLKAKRYERQPGFKRLFE